MNNSVNNLMQNKYATYGGFIKGILRGVRCTKSLRVLFLHDSPPPGPLLYCTQEQYSSLMSPPIECCIKIYASYKWGRRFRIEFSRVTPLSRLIPAISSMKSAVEWSLADCVHRG